MKHLIGLGWISREKDWHQSVLSHAIAQSLTSRTAKPITSPDWLPCPTLHSMNSICVHLCHHHSSSALLAESALLEAEAAVPIIPGVLVEVVVVCSAEATPTKTPIKGSDAGTIAGATAPRGLDARRRCWQGPVLCSNQLA